MKNSIFKRLFQFTLIELLMIISIIAILTTILLPALKKAKDKVKSTDCQSRLRQMTLGMAYYTSDNNAWYPYMNVGDWRHGTNCFEAINEYVFGSANPKKAPEFYRCAADNRPSTHTLMSYGVNAHRNGSGIKDGIWNFENGTFSDGTDYSGIPSRVNMVKSTSATFLLACAGKSLHFYDWNSYLALLAPQDTNSHTWMAFLHNNATNWGFCDGHVSWMRWQDSIGTGTNQYYPKGIWTKSSATD